MQIVNKHYWAIFWLIAALITWMVVAIQILNYMEGIMEETKIYQVNGTYRIVFERAASANKTDGFKVEVNGDDPELTKQKASEIYRWADIESMTFSKTAPAGGK